MARVLLAAVLGAITVFTWGFVSWNVLNLYGFAFKNMPNASAIVPAIQASMPADGTYVFPIMPDFDQMDAEQRKAAEADWAQRHTTGPIGMVMYRANGTDPMHWSVMARGFAFLFAAAFALSCLMYGLRLRTTSFRLAFTLLVVAFGMMVSHAQQWNWLFMPDTYTMALVADTFAGWILGGGVIAMLVRPSGGPASSAA